jgi:pyruvate/oxaloacetate carboxyltransferase
MVAQLKEADALHRLPEVYAELPQTLRELGYLPLVTPISRIVGTQAINKAKEATKDVAKDIGDVLMT